MEVVINFILIWLLVGFISAPILLYPDVKRHKQITIQYIWEWCLGTAGGALTFIVMLMFLLDKFARKFDQIKDRQLYKW